MSYNNRISSEIAILCSLLIIGLKLKKIKLKNSFIKNWIINYLMEHVIVLFMGFIKIIIIAITMVVISLLANFIIIRDFIISFNFTLDLIKVNFVGFINQFVNYF